LPLYSIIIQHGPPLNVCITIFDGEREINIGFGGLSGLLPFDSK
jgi:hypothetical protein